MYLLIFFLLLLLAVICHFLLASYVRRHLSYAGWHRPTHYVAFLTVSLLLIAICLLWTLYRYSEIPPLQPLEFFAGLWLILPLLIAIFLPFLWLRYEERQYQWTLRKESAYIINFIIIYLEAGYTIDQTLEHLLAVLQLYKYRFAKELQITWYDLRYLGNRSLAWQRLLDRLGNPEWLFFVRLLQKEELYDRYLIDSFVRDSETLSQMRLAIVEFTVIRSINFALVIAYLCFLPAVLLIFLGPMIAFVFS